MMTAKKMTLEEARTALERQGFSCVDDDEEQPNRLVGVLSECRWSMMAKMDVMVFVHHIQGNLTSDRIEQDLRALPDLVLDHSRGGCPPFGASRGRIVLLVYLVDGQIEPAALSWLLAVPQGAWCSLTFLAAQDGEGMSRFLESSTPCWGRALYPETRYWAGLLTGREVPPQRPAASQFLVFVNVFCLFYIVFLGLTVDFPVRFWVIFLGSMVILFVAAWACDWCRRQGRRHPKNGQGATDSGGTAFVRLESQKSGEHMV